MTDIDPSISSHERALKRRIWPWVVSAVVLMLLAVFLTIWIPYRKAKGLLKQIALERGVYSINEHDRPQSWSALNSFEFIPWFDEVDVLYFSRTVPSTLFRNSMGMFTSLETLEFDLGNSADFTRESALRMDGLKFVKVTSDEAVEVSDYEFLAGCDAVEHLILEGKYHDDGFWQYLPDMKSLKRLELQVGPEVRGAGIPNLATSALAELTINGDVPDCEFQGFGQLLTAARLERLTISQVVFTESELKSTITAHALNWVSLHDTKSTDRIVPLLARVSSLKHLDLSKNQMTGEFFDQLASLPLDRFSVAECPLNEKGVRNLAQFRFLKHLSLRSLPIETAWLSSWRDSPLSLRLNGLSLQEIKIDEETIDVLADFHSLHALSLERASVNPAWLSSWRDSPLSLSLKELRLYESEIDENTIDLLQTFPSLGELSISGTTLSDEAILKCADFPSLWQLSVKRDLSGELVERIRERVKANGKTYFRLY